MRTSPQAAGAAQNPSKICQPKLLKLLNRCPGRRVGQNHMVSERYAHVQTKRLLRDIQFSVSFRVGDWTGRQLIQRMLISSGPIVGQDALGRRFAMDKYMRIL